MTEPNYKPTPSTATQNVLRASNSQRSRVTNSYKGITGSPFDNDLFNLKMDRKPTVIPIYEKITENEIELSKDKRRFFSPKQYQTIIANFDLSNLNATYDNIGRIYVYPTNDNRYYNNTFSKVGLEKVFKINSGNLSIPKSTPCDQSRLFVQIQTTDFNIANYGNDYMFPMVPDSALSTTNRTTFKATPIEYQLNGYCSLNDIKLSISDVAGNIIFKEPRMDFAIVTVGATTELYSPNHGLSNGMLIYLDRKSNRKDVFSRIYPVTVVSPDVISIPVDTTNLAYLVGVILKVIIDDYVFNYTIRVFSIREDENTLVANTR